MNKALSEKIAEAVEIIKNVNFDEMELGKHVINDDFYMLLQTYETKKPETARHEAHKKYVDVQYIVEGMEQIDIAPASEMEVEDEYNEEKDIVFFKEPAQATTFVLTTGSYAVLYPEDSHKPGVCVGKQAQVKKIVGKVRI